jgi:hypothetical protein
MVAFAAGVPAIEAAVKMKMCSAMNLHDHGSDSGSETILFFRGEKNETTKQTLQKRFRESGRNAAEP